MANATPLQILSQGGVARWSSWRRENTGLTADLADADSIGGEECGAPVRGTRRDGAKR